MTTASTHSIPHDTTEKPARPKKAARQQNTPEHHELLPQAHDAERAVLSCLLMDPAKVVPVLDERGITDEWFHNPAHQTIYQASREMLGTGKAFDFITLTQHLNDTGRLEISGGAGNVTELFTYLPTAANLSYYLAILAEKHAARRVLQVAMEFAGRVREEADRVGELVDEFQQAVLKIDRPDSTGVETIRHIKPAVLEAIEGISQTYHARGGITGLPSGFHALDRMTGGLQGPILVVVAGRPSMGKSAFMWNIAEHLAITLRKPVLGFSLEMSMRELAQRMICGRANINLQRIRDGFLSEEDMSRRLPIAGQSVAVAPIHIDETPGLSIQELRVRARRFVHNHPETAAVFVDYMQLCKSTSRQAQSNRALEIGEISGGLKNLAKELDRPVIVGAQLNRDNDGANQLPKLSNLRESGSIEQDADWVILLHRKHYYTKAEEDLDQADVILGKQRNGPTGLFPLVFKTELGRFANPDGEQMYSNNPAHRQGGYQGGDE